MKKRIAFFGGTFNPIHYGHLILAEHAREALECDRVLFVPAAVPPHKQSDALPSGNIRLKLVQRAIRGNKAFLTSDVELLREGVSYTVDTLTFLQARWPQAEWFLLIGEDQLAVHWKGWEELKQRCTIVVAHRPGATPHRREEGLYWLAMPQLEISSSDIRARVKEGRSIRYLVPSAVESAIVAHNLYR